MILRDIYRNSSCSIDSLDLAEERLDWIVVRGVSNVLYGHPAEIVK